MEKLKTEIAGANEHSISIERTKDYESDSSIQQYEEQNMEDEIVNEYIQNQ
jgi:hypothetical protein